MRKVLLKSKEFLLAKDGSLTTKTIRSGFWVGFSSIITNSLNLVRTVILARLLLPEIFGLMAICLTVMRSVEVFTRTGVNAALIYRKESFEEARDTAFTIMMMRGVILFVLIYLFAPSIALFYKNDILSDLIKVIAISFIFNGFNNINTIALTKELDFKRLTYLDQASSIVNTVVVVALAYVMRSIWALVIGHVLSSAVQMAMSYILIPGRPRFHYDRKLARELYQYGKYVTGLSIVLFIASELDNVVLGKIVGMSDLGYYVIAFTLANLPSTHISAVASKIMLPAYSKLQDDLPALKDAYLRTVRIVTSVSIPAAIGLMALAPEIVQVIYGSKWMPAVAPLQILCVFGALRSVASLNGYLLNGIGKPNIDFYTGSLRMIMVAILIYPLTKAYHLVGASIAVTVPMALQFILSTYAAARFVKVGSFDILNSLLFPLVYSAIMAIVLLTVKGFFSSADAFRLVSLVVIGVLTYAALSWRDLFSLWAYYKRR